MLSLNDITLDKMTLPTLDDVNLDVTANVAAGSCGYVEAQEDEELETQSDEPPTDDNVSAQSDDESPTDDDESPTDDETDSEE